MLCHDDVIGNRLVSFVLYLVDEDWSEEDGGAFELFPVVDGEPSPIPCNRVDCKWNSLLLFKVEPGKSHHAVAEVLGDKPRLTISGWYHAREQRDGAAARASSLGQLRVAEQRVFKNFDGDEDEDDVDRALSARTCLLWFLGGPLSRPERGRVYGSTSRMTAPLDWWTFVVMKLQ